MGKQLLQNPSSKSGKLWNDVPQEISSSNVSLTKESKQFLLVLIFSALWVTYSFTNGLFIKEAIVSSIIINCLMFFRIRSKESNS